MVSGTIFAIVCPMLEDELIESLKDDPEEKRVIVLDNEFNGSVRRKLEMKGVAFETMDIWDFEHDPSLIDRSKFNVVIKMKDLALHAEPEILKKDLEDELVMLKGKVDSVAMYYGMCGNVYMDLTEYADQHDIGIHVSTFRDCDGRVCDDCVGVTVGGLKGYQRLLKEFTGVMLFTPAIATNWVDFLGASPTMRSVLGTDMEFTMKDMLELCGYNSVVQIDNGYEPREEFDKATQEFAKEMGGFKILQASPDFIDKGPMMRLYQEAKDALKQ